MSKNFFEEIKREYPSGKLDIIGTERIKLKTIDGGNIKIKVKIGSQIQITDNIKVALDLLVIGYTMFDILLGYNFLEMVDYIMINIKKPEIVVKTTMGETQCKFTNNTKLKIKKTDLGDNTRALVKSIAQSTQVKGYQLEVLPPPKKNATQGSIGKSPFQEAGLMKLNIAKRKIKPENINDVKAKQKIDDIHYDPLIIGNNTSSNIYTNLNGVFMEDMRQEKRGFPKMKFYEFPDGAEKKLINWKERRKKADNEPAENIMRSWSQ